MAQPTSTQNKLVSSHAKSDPVASLSAKEGNGRPIKTIKLCLYEIYGECNHKCGRKHRGVLHFSPKFTNYREFIKKERICVSYMLFGKCGHVKQHYKTHLNKNEVYRKYKNIPVPHARRELDDHAHVDQINVQNLQILELKEQLAQTKAELSTCMEELLKIRATNDTQNNNVTNHENNKASIQKIDIAIQVESAFPAIDSSTQSEPIQMEKSDKAMQTDMDKSDKATITDVSHIDMDKDMINAFRYIHFKHPNILIEAFKFCDDFAQHTNPSASNTEEATSATPTRLSKSERKKRAMNKNK